MVIVVVVLTGSIHRDVVIHWNTMLVGVAGTKGLTLLPLPYHIIEYIYMYMDLPVVQVFIYISSRSTGYKDLLVNME